MNKFCYQAVPEETIFIDLPGTDGLKIKGILRGSLTQPLVVMMHGRPGSCDDLIEYLGARYLYEKGFASLRLSMYDYEPETRNLVDCTLGTHVQDFDAVITYVRAKNTPKLFAVGHSYGGLTILKSEAQLDGAALWDPSHGLYWQNKKLDNTDRLYDEFIVNLEGKGRVLPRALVEHGQAMGDTSNWAANKQFPLAVITAGDGVLRDYGRKYYAAADEPKKYIEIKRATHNFRDSDEVMLQLFAETAEWFKEILHGKY